MIPRLLSKRNDSRTIARCEVYREVDDREVTIEVTVGGYIDDDLEFYDETICGMPTVVVFDEDERENLRQQWLEADCAHYERRVESRLPS